jgi:hypothetical protein
MRSITLKRNACVVWPAPSAVLAAGVVLAVLAGCALNGIAAEPSSATPSSAESGAATPTSAVAEENKNASEKPTQDDPTQQPVKVFILTGQSNMEGKGLALHLDTYKDDPLIRDTYPLLKQDGHWIERDDVWITYPTMPRNPKHGPLTVGYGTKGEDSIGPEFGFGHTVGQALDCPVVLIKIAWGGKSLAVDFLPPSAELPDDAALEAILQQAQKKNPQTTLTEVKARYGHFYRELVRQAKRELERLPRTFPNLAGRDVEIAGLVWHQGDRTKSHAPQRT